MSPASVQRKLEGRRCEALLVYEAYDADGLVDGVATLVLGVDQGDPGGEWVRVFFDAGRWSWTASTERPAAPQNPSGELRFPATDLAALVGVAITVADLVPGESRRGGWCSGSGPGRWRASSTTGSGRACG